MARKISFTGRLPIRRRRPVRLFSDWDCFYLYFCFGLILSLFTFSKMIAVIMILQPATLLGFGISNYQFLLCVMVSLLTSLTITAVLVEKLRYAVLKC